MVALLSIVGVRQANAYTVSDLTDDGWTQLTTIEGLQTAITNDSYFALVSGRGSNLMVKSMAWGDYNRPIYQTIDNPIMDNGLAWILEYEDSKYYLKNANKETVYYGYEGNASWDYVAKVSYTSKTSAKSNLGIALSEGKYKITTEGGGYLGAWNDNSFTKGMRIAGNKGSAQADEFVIYAISKTAYAAKQQAIVDAATNVDGKDVSFLIKDANLDVCGNLSPWTGGVVITGDAANGSYVSEKYHVANTNIYQTLTGIANGKYTVSAQGTYRQDGGSTDKAILYAGTQTANLTNFSSIDVSGYGGNDAAKVQQYLIAHPETKATIENVIVTDGTLTLGIKTDAVGANNLWVVYDNFKLTYYGIDLTALEEEYENAKTNGQNALDNALYVNVTGSERTALSTALTTYATCESTQEALEEAISALNSAYTTFINAKTSYDNLVSMRAEGATYTIVAWPNASAAKKTALDNAINAVPTSASDAVTKTNAIVTAYRQFVESSGLAEGVDVAINKTSSLLVSDASVSTSGWTSGSIGTNTNEPYTTGEGTTPSKYFDGGWSASAGVDITLTQELTLPAGEYQVQITARGATNLTSYTMSVGESSVDLPHVGSSGGTFGRGWSDKYITFTSDGSPVTLTIAAKSTDHYQWISFNRLRLIRLNAVLADADDYDALNSAISDAEAKLGFEVGEYAPYNNKDVASKYAEAKAIDQDAKNEKETIQAVTTYLNTPSNWTTPNVSEVNAIYWKDYTSGDIAGDGYIHPLGWTNTGYNTRIYSDAAGNKSTNTGISAVHNLAMMSKYNTTYGETAGYTMPLKANTIYKLTFKYCGWGNTPTTNIVLTDPESNTITLAPGFRPATNNGNTNAENWYSYTGYFVSTTAGNYVLAMNKVDGGQQQIGIGDIELVTASEIVFADGSVPTYAPGTYPSVKITRNLTAGRWATAVYPFAVSGVDNIAVLNSYDKATGALVFTSAAASTANEPFFMMSTTDKSEITLSGVAVAAANATPATASEASLIGTYTTTEITNAEKNYVLSTNQICSVGDAGATINPYRAYIQIDESTPVKVLSFIVDGTATGVEAPEVTEAEEEEILYNTAGVRVGKDYKGIVINQKGEKRLQK